jgi:hypothetical protein
MTADGAEEGVAGLREQARRDEGRRRGEHDVIEQQLQKLGHHLLATRNALPTARHTHARVSFTMDTRARVVR